jgi:hypothetical protein
VSNMSRAAVSMMSVDHFKACSNISTTTGIVTISYSRACIF